MPTLVDLTGQKFGRLTAISRNQKVRPARWTCICKCGVTKDVATSDLTRGKTKSCGCLKIEMVRDKNLVHEMSGHALYEVWKSIKDRCLRKKNRQYKDYGGRGITICDEWINDGAAFIRWSLANGYRAGLLIDREDNDLGYSPENCRFVTRKISNGNRRNNHYIETNLGRITIAEATDMSGLTRGTIRRRIKLGWPASKILQPSRGIKKHNS